MKLDTTTDPYDPPYLYSAVVGSLFFAHTLSRPDISFAMSAMVQISSNPHRSHFRIMDHIYRYISSTLNLALCFDGSSSTLVLEAYADADYAEDITNRKSRMGSVLLLNDIPVAWYSHKQTCVATSTT